MQHTKKLLVASGAVAAAMVGSALFATPAFADTALQGTVLDGGTPVANVDVELYQLDPGSNHWSHDLTLGTTDASGAWSYSSVSNLDTGTYALWYDVDGSASIYAQSQASNGATQGAKSVSRVKFGTDFTVTSGAPSTSTFSSTLVHNGGALAISLVDNAGTKLDNALASSGQADIYGYDYDLGYLYNGYHASESGSDFDGTIVVGHLAPALYTGSTEATGYGEEPLNPTTVAVGQTVNYGTVTLQTDATDSVLDHVTSPKAVSVSGDPKVGTVLTATVPTSTTGTPLSITYQWVDGAEAPIAGATAQTFIPTVGNIGDRVLPVAILRLPGYRSATLYANDLTEPIKVGDPNQAPVTISGSAKYDGTLKATVGAGTVADAKAAGYQWYRNGAVIAGADGSSYKVGKADVGQAVFASVTSFSQGHTDAVIPSNTVTIAKEKGSVAYKAAKSISKSKKLKVTVTLKDGVSGNNATGKVKVYYSSKKFKTVTFTSKTKSKKVTLPKLSKGKHTIKITYAGDTHYSSKTTKFTVKVK